MSDYLYPYWRKWTERIVVAATKEPLNFVHVFLGAKFAEPMAHQVLLLLIQDDDLRGIELFGYFVDLCKLSTERMLRIRLSGECVPKR